MGTQVIGQGGQVPHHQGGRALPEDGVDLAPPDPGVQPGGDGASLRGGRVAHRVVDRGRQHQRHHVPAPDAAAEKLGREQVGPRQPLAEGHPLVAVDVGLAFAQLNGDRVHELLHRGGLTAQRRPRLARHWLPPSFLVDCPGRMMVWDSV